MSTKKRAEGRVNHQPGSGVFFFKNTEILFQCPLFGYSQKTGKSSLMQVAPTGCRV